MTKSITNYVAVAFLAIAMVLGSFAFVTTTEAAVNSSSITITTTNRGTIDNDTTSTAWTGANRAGGSEGGRGGDGGDVESGAGDYNNGGAGTGAGGDGGDAAAGGLVNTGDATADAGTTNSLNNSDVEVDLTLGGAGDINSTSVAVDTDNQLCQCDSKVNNIDNVTDADARTGANRARGSEGGNADDAGEIESDGTDGDYNNGGATTGNGGDGGAGGLGGEVNSGDADATSGAINLLNTTITRVRI